MPFETAPFRGSTLDGPLLTRPRRQPFETRLRDGGPESDGPSQSPLAARLSRRALVLGETGPSRRRPRLSIGGPSLDGVLLQPLLSTVPKDEGSKWALVRPRLLDGPRAVAETGPRDGPLCQLCPSALGPVSTGPIDGLSTRPLVRPSKPRREGPPRRSLRGGPSLTSDRRALSVLTESLQTGR